MNQEDTRKELDACTLRPGDASAEALAAAAEDRTLKQWLERRAHFDQTAAAAFLQSDPPAGLLEELQAIQPTAQRARRAVSFVAVKRLAAVAAILIASAMGWWQYAKQGGWESEVLAHMKLIQFGIERLDHREPRLDELKQYLAEQNHLSPEDVPSSLTQLRTHGCRVVQVAGKPATIICFDLAPGKEAHLLVMNKSDLPNPPSTQRATEQRGAWSLVKWSSGSHVYLLATKDDASLVSSLFAMLPGRRSHPEVSRHWQSLFQA